MGMLLTMVAGLMYVAYGYGQLFAEWRQAAAGPVAPAKTTAFELNPMMGSLPLEGPWIFADLEWDLRSTIVNAKDVDAKLDALRVPPSGELKNFPDASLELLELIQSLPLQPVELSGCQLYAISRSGLKAQLLLRKVEGSTKVLTCAGGFAQDNQHWQMFELAPRAASIHSAEHESHLLPLPAGAVRRGGRFADDGRLLLELISLGTDSDSLITAWRGAGWEVRPSGLGVEGGFSYLCARGNDVIYAWSADPSESLQSLMLVRSPTDAELQAEQFEAASVKE